MHDQERPFNQPDSRLGKWIFAFIGWMEARIRATSKVGATAFFDEARFPWLPALKAEWREVQAEAEAVLAV